jgi:hypothetical protein
MFQGASSIATPGISNPATIEAIACREALALAEDLNLSHVCIASDCLEVINSIRDGSSGIYSTILREIAVRRRHFVAVLFVHEKRTSNTHAHNLSLVLYMLSPDANCGF